MRTLLLAGVLISTITSTAFGQRGPYTPSRGSIERQQIMEAFRVPIARQLGRTVIFNDVRLRVQNGWAFVWAVPRSTDGRRVIDLDAPDCVNCTDNVVGLLQWRRSRWVVVDFQIAPGELPYEWRRYPAPPAIFPWNWRQ